MHVAFRARLPCGIGAPSGVEGSVPFRSEGLPRDHMLLLPVVMGLPCLPHLNVSSINGRQFGSLVGHGAQGPAGSLAWWVPGKSLLRECLGVGGQGGV